MQAHTQERIISRERGPLGGILGERSIQPKTMLMRACPLHIAYYPATETILRKEKFLFFTVILEYKGLHRSYIEEKS